MSIYYGMYVSIANPSIHAIENIRQAASREWPFEQWDSYESKSVGDEGQAVTRVTAYAEGSLCGGEREDVFARRLTWAIWQANQAYCEVEVQATYLEDLPHEDYCFDEDDYDKFLAREGGDSHE